MNSEVWCGACKGIGYTTVRNGDDDIECEVCHGSGDAQPVASVAVEEALSPIAQLRMEYQNYQHAIAYRHILKSFYANEEIRIAKNKLVEQAEDKIIMLLDTIDSQAAVIAQQQAALEAANKKITRFFGFYEDVLNVTENGESGKRYQQIAYYLLHTASRFRLPFPFATRAEAEQHMQRLLSVYEIVEVEDVTREADEEDDEMALRERAEQLTQERWETK